MDFCKVCGCEKEEYGVSNSTEYVDYGYCSIDHYYIGYILRLEDNLCSFETGSALEKAARFLEEERESYQEKLNRLSKEIMQRTPGMTYTMNKV